MKTRPFLFAQASPVRVFVVSIPANRSSRWRTLWFAESMLETSWAQRARRSWTTLTSFGLQVLIIGCCCCCRCGRRSDCRRRERSLRLSAWGELRLRPRPLRRTTGGPVAQATVVPGRLMQPARIPHVIKTGPDDSPSGPVERDQTPGIDGVGASRGVDGRPSHVFDQGPGQFCRRLLRRSPGPSALRPCWRAT